MLKRNFARLLMLFAGSFIIANAYADECTAEQKQWLNAVNPQGKIVNEQGETRSLAQSYESVCKVWSAHPEYTIMTNGWVTEKEDFSEGDLEVLLFDTETGKLKNRYYKENQLDSDAVYVSGLEIDTGLYKISPKDSMPVAFGIRVSYKGSSKPNPFGSTNLTLLMPEEDKLKPVLLDYEVNSDGGEWDTNCQGVFNDVKSTLSVLPTAHKGFFDIAVQSQQNITSYIVNRKTKECQDQYFKKHAFQNTLQFNGTEYKQVTKRKELDYSKYLP